MATTHQRKMLERVEELIADGYLLKGSAPGTIILTAKGLRCLMACADRPVKKPKASKKPTEQA